MRPLSTNIGIENKAESSSIFTTQKTTWLWSPLILFACMVIIDQASKYWIVLNIGPHTKHGEIIDLFNGFIWIVKVYNKGIAFSLASDTDWWIRLLVVYLIPLLLVLFLLKIIIYSNFETPFRWYASLVAGGGVGNLIDRLFREEGVVDFISVNTYNIFGMSRWATFNFADTSVVVGMGLWIITLFMIQKSHSTSGQEEDNTDVSTSKQATQDTI